ncbi:MAG TPA: hypothetical protein VKQ11_05750 [Candidatus Sulfotelmatobacter sp.]|nr:hypothetical protein [Candidatus Sulfotelmatobacter sp.]
MSNRNYREHQRRCEQHLEHTKDAYVFNPSSGIHEPKTTDPQDQSEHRQPGSNSQSPLFVNPRTDWRPVWINAILSLLTLVVIGLYTYVTQGIFGLSQATATGTIQASYATRDAADSSKDASRTAAKSFEASNRAWIKPLYLYDCKPVVANQFFEEPFNLKNVGRGIAGNISGLIVVQFLRLDEMPDFHYTTGHPREYMRANMLYPDDSTHNTIPMIPIDKDGSPHMTTPIESQEFTRGNEWIALHGRIDYVDLTSGKHHWLTFCTPRTSGISEMEKAKRALTSCLDWNRIDHN